MDIYGNYRRMISRAYLKSKVTAAQNAATKRAIVFNNDGPIQIDSQGAAGSNAYAIGYQLGQIDAYKNVTKLLEELPDQDPDD